MSTSLDEHLEYVLCYHERNGTSKTAWFLLAVVAVRALVSIAESLTEKVEFQVAT